jgi:hypothetical protein
LIDEKKEMEKKARVFINRYQKLLLGVSIVHILSFGWGIFMVDWIGWDIIEPITYSLDQVTLFLGLVFYYRFGICRDNDTMLDASLKSHLQNDKTLYEKYQNLKEVLR